MGPTSHVVLAVLACLLACNGAAGFGVAPATSRVAARRSAAPSRPLHMVRGPRPSCARAGRCTHHRRLRSQPVRAVAASALLRRAQVVESSALSALNDIVIVQADTEAKKTVGGLFLASVADQLGAEVDPNYRVGTVVAVGEGRVREDGSLIPMPFEKGQRVVMPGSSSIGVQLDILLGSLGLFAYRQHELVATH
jgi:co-chaperonin GroES (HSP10)